MKQKQGTPGVLAQILRPARQPQLPKAVWETKAARNSFVKLAKNGADPNEMAAILSMLALLAEAKATGWPEMEQGLLPKETRLTWRQLKARPARLERAARKIQLINESVLLNPRLWTRATLGNEPAELARHFLQLPLSMRIYAQYLRRRLGQIGVFRKAKFSVPKLLQVLLLETVRKGTGHYYFEDVAEMLDAIHQALADRSHTEVPALTGGNLSKLLKNNPKLRRFAALRAMSH